MATTKNTARKLITKASTRAKALKRTAVRVQRPAMLARLIEAQEQAREAVEAARVALDKAVSKNASEARIEALLSERDDAAEAFAQARFARWGAMHADRAVERADGTFPPSVENDSNGIRTAIVARLEAQLAYERSLSTPDTDRIQAISKALRTARKLVD